jgi:hypothetical protein
MPIGRVLQLKSENRNFETGQPNSLCAHNVCVATKAAELMTANKPWRDPTTGATSAIAMVRRPHVARATPRWLTPDVTVQLWKSQSATG